MPIGISAALLISGAASAGAAAYTAHASGKAVGKATDAQTLANDQALALLKEEETKRIARMQQANALLERTGETQRGIYDRQIDSLSPYTSLGGGAATLLGQGLGVNVSLPSMGPLSSFARPSVGAHPAAPVQFAPNAQQLTPSNPANPDGTVTSRGTPLGGQVSTAVPRIPNAAVPHTPIWSQMTQGGLVTMRAPDGSTQAVPREQVPHWQQQGAAVVS